MKAYLDTIESFSEAAEYNEWPPALYKAILRAAEQHWSTCQDMTTDDFICFCYESAEEIE